jgi:hypothetical protein
MKPQDYFELPESEDETFCFVFEALMKSKTDDEARKILMLGSQMNPSEWFEVEPRSYFYYRDYEFEVGIACYMEQERDHLAIANRARVAAAPRLRAFREYPANGRALLIRCTPGTSREEDLKCCFSGFSDSATFNCEVKNQLRLDVETLLGLGYAHEFAHLGYRHWYAHPLTGHVMFDQWRNLVEIGENDRGGYLESINRLLG